MEQEKAHRQFKSYGMPFNFFKWVEEHKETLKPPVGNAMLWNEGDLKIMVVGGPNQRTDYHFNQTEEFFFQLKGNMCLKIMENGEPKDIHIKEGEMFLLPACTPHSPQREADSVGLVVELDRPKEMLDGMWWYCIHCGAKQNERWLHAQNLATDLKPIMIEYYDSDKLRTCNKCNKLTPDPRTLFTINKPADAATDADKAGDAEEKPKE